MWEPIVYSTPRSCDSSVIVSYGIVAFAAPVSWLAGRLWEPRHKPIASLAIYRMVTSVPKTCVLCDVCMQPGSLPALAGPAVGNYAEEKTKIG